MCPGQSAWRWWWHFWGWMVGCLEMGMWTRVPKGLCCVAASVVAVCVGGREAGGWGVSVADAVALFVTAGDVCDGVGGVAWCWWW